MSALHWAAENNHARIVRILLEAGSNRSLMNKFGKTALCLAAAKNHFEACEVLQVRQYISLFHSCGFILKLRMVFNFLGPR